MTIDSAGVHFGKRYDGYKFCLGHPRDRDLTKDLVYVQEFTLTEAGQAFWLPDHHGPTIFIIKEIDGTKVILQYECSIFQGGTFIDTGEIILEPFKSE